MLSYRSSSFLFIVCCFAGILVFAGCTKEEDEDVVIVYTDPFPFPLLPEENTGSRARSVTYVYDRTAQDPTYPPKIDSSVILFSYTADGNIDRIRLTHRDFIVYDFNFERVNNKLVAIRCNNWVITPDPEIIKSDLLLEYNASGMVSLLKASEQNDPFNEVDSFIIKATGSRIDTVIDRTFYNGNGADKYAFKYNANGDIIQVEDIYTTGIFFVYENIFKFTLSASPSAQALGNDAIIWNFFASHVDISSSTDFMIPPLFFHSTKQPSKLELQASGFYTGTYNYQTEYYSSGRPKKMTANVITQAGNFYAREAYYYTYAQ